MSEIEQAARQVIDFAKDQSKEQSDILTLSTGVRVRLKPVDGIKMAHLAARFKYPDPPMIKVKSKGRFEPNYNDPDYIEKCQAIDNARGIAMIDAFLMFGVQLVDGVPDDSAWARELQLIGVEFDYDDPVERKFYYKKYVAVGDDDLGVIQSRFAVSAEGVAAQEASFPGN